MNAIIFLQIRSDVAIEKQLRKKEDKVKFTIGMIVSHLLKNSMTEERIYHYGVIIGWHYKFNQIFLNELMKCYKFPYHSPCRVDSDKKIDQPHYIVLSENNTICYLRQGMKVSIFH